MAKRRGMAWLSPLDRLCGLLHREQLCWADRTCGKKCGGPGCLLSQVEVSRFEAAVASGVPIPQAARAAMGSALDRVWQTAQAVLSACEAQAAEPEDEWVLPPAGLSVNAVHTSRLPDLHHIETRGADE